MFALAFPHLGEETLAKTGGIVLIDELDFSLHPKWQRVVADSLKKTFPLVQFIVTTHSPFIIQSLAKDVNPDNIDEFLWPDKDNTYAALEYGDGVLRRVTSTLLSTEDSKRAQNFIELVGLDDGYALSGGSTEKWNDRRKEWDKAMDIKKGS